MKRTNTLGLCFATALIFLAGTALAPSTAVLEYKMPVGRTLTYVATSEEAQVMEVMGNSVENQSTSTSTFTFKAKGTKGKDYLLSASIDDMAITATSSMTGGLTPDVSSVKGKSFDMVLSPLGVEVDVAGAEAITMTIEGETRSMANAFRLFFPDLPGKAVKVGDTWPATNAITETAGAMTIRIEQQLVNTLEGFETIDGMECAKVSAEITGTVSGSGNQMGQELTFSGKMTGKMIWFFAVKEGIFVKESSDTTSQISVDVPAAGMTIPMTQTAKAEVKLTVKS